MTVSVSGHITRTELALANLQLNSGDYKLSGVFDPGGVTWDRQKVSSAFVDGDITVHRRKAMSTMTLGVEITASTFALLQTAKDTLITAFSQDDFEIYITLGGTQYAWDCEAADYSVTWDRPRIHALTQLAVFEIPRQPVPLLGPV